MNSVHGKVWSVLAACGAAIGVAQAAVGQPFVVNVSGATLMENTIKAPASTNDFIDCDGDGTAGSLGSFSIDQLAPFGINPFVAGERWIIQYRVVGSVNGFQELIDWGTSFAAGPDGAEISALTASLAYFNRSLYITAGVGSASFFNASNPGGAPVRTDTGGLYEATQSTGAGTGVQIDVAPLDVPSRWASRSSGQADFGRKPGEAGYGSNPAQTVNKDGTQNGFDHLLASLGGLNLFDAGNPGVADSNTLFDTPLAFAPIAATTNLGTGMSQIRMSDLRHMSVTGRMSSGENLIQVTRDSGSGTRNGYMNSIGIDPSWGVGENVGGLSTLANANILGPGFQPSGKGGSSGLDATVNNARLGIGYSGAERAVTGSGAFVTGGRAEVLAVRNDVPYGGTQFSRPNIDEILDNTADGFVIGGPGTLVTIGDPRAASAADGGDAGNTNPAMRNRHAACYVNNMTRSIASFVALPGGPTTDFMPGELIATLLILTDGLDFLQNPTDPTNLIPNPGFNPSLQTFLRGQSTLGNAALLNFGTVTLDGKVPTRQTGVVYTDGVANGANYRSQGGVNISYAGNLTSRNRIAGDFNGDGLRNWNDSAALIAAWRDRNGGPAWVPVNGSGAIAGALGSDAIIEVLGDFNGDGNFNSADVRYWADGLAVDPATKLLNRSEGYLRVDQAQGGNFFGTVLATPSAVYDMGDSRADVAGPSGNQAPGWAPVGADGVIDAFDIDYVYRQFKRNSTVTDGELNWNDLNEASTSDLSADISGDLKVNISDVTMLVQNILETSFGDANLDGVVDGADLAIVTTNLGGAGGWASGDFDGDGLVTAADQEIVVASLCPGDADRSGSTNFADITAVLSNWSAVFAAPTAGAGDANYDGVVNFADITAVLSNWAVVCP